MTMGRYIDLRFGGGVPPLPKLQTREAQNAPAEPLIHARLVSVPVLLSPIIPCHRKMQRAELSRIQRPATSETPTTAQAHLTRLRKQVPKSTHSN